MLRCFYYLQLLTLKQQDSDLERRMESKWEKVVSHPHLTLTRLRVSLRSWDLTKAEALVYHILHMLRFTFQIVKSLLWWWTPLGQELMKSRDKLVFMQRSLVWKVEYQHLMLQPDITRLLIVTTLISHYLSLVNSEQSHLDLVVDATLQDVIYIYLFIHYRN